MIDREALVRRHNVRYKAVEPRAPLSVGNGEFAVTVDATGLQSLPDAYPAPGRSGDTKGSLLGTQSQWGWHSTPAVPVPSLEETKREYQGAHGPVRYVDLSGKTSATSTDAGTPAETWLRNNPHRLMLGAIALAAESAGRKTLNVDDLQSIDQELDLFTGIVRSRFRVGAVSFIVQTAVHPELDTLAVRIMADGAPGPAVRLHFPYGSEDWGNAADWSKPDFHTSRLRTLSGGWMIDRRLDDAAYSVGVTSPEAELLRVDDHEFLLHSRGATLELSLNFTPGSAVDAGIVDGPSAEHVFLASASAWRAYWSKGGMIDFSGSTDPRAGELERRVVLSQYLTRVNCSGSLPPQETGLTVNSWRGRFHLEMHWWHAAHFPVWNRSSNLERSLAWYASILDSARGTAAAQGLRGARWPKQVGPDGRESPSDVGPFLIWQQPHPIYFAELVWRSNPTPEILERYAPLVFQTAEFMASYAAQGPDGFELGPPLIPAQESYAAMRAEVRNPAFELAYWQWALATARRWQQRLGLPAESSWTKVETGLVAPHVREGAYSSISVPPYSVRTDHPSMLAALGVVPYTPLIDAVTMSATYDDVLADWDWASTWGWDFPMLAMCAARLGRPEDAVAALLMDAPKNTYLKNGHNFQTESLPLYLPGNGGVLMAVALMARGWDGSGALPGFPDDGRWAIQMEDILPLP